MKKFQVKFLREFEVEIEAEDSANAARLAAQIPSQFPKDTCKLLSIIAEDAGEQPCQACLEFGPIKESVAPRGPGNRPLGGGSPGTPVVRVPVEMVDQIAEAA